MVELKISASKEWLDEPNREDFEHAGYKCLILRNPELLHLCGYVAVPRGHTCYRKHYDYIPYPDLLSIDVHGGLTFSDEGNGKTWPAGLWWLGFDCAHFGDLVPKIEDLTKRFYDEGHPESRLPYAEALKEYSMRDTYRNFQYVRQEVNSLADQLAKLEFIDWQFTWVWPLLLPLRTARWIWTKRRIVA